MECALQHRPASNRLANLIAGRISEGLLGGQLAQLDHACHDGLVFGDLFQDSLMEMVNPAIADVANHHTAIPDQDHGRGGGHSLEVRVDGCLLADSVVGILQGGFNGVRQFFSARIFECTAQRPAQKRGQRASDAPDHDGRSQFPGSVAANAIGHDNKAELVILPLEPGQMLNQKTVFIAAAFVTRGGDACDLEAKRTRRRGQRFRACPV